jgi:hypothetical protein
MKSPLVHGCYDLATLKTLISLGITRFAFDLRARSPNLVTFCDLKLLVNEVPSAEITVVFQDDRSSTVLSFLDLLKSTGRTIIPEFRDQQDPSYYHVLEVPFIWMFHPEGKWREILSLPNLAGVVLPMKWRSEYQRLTGLWEIIEKRNFPVLVHTEDLTIARSLRAQEDLELSIDLTSEVEQHYRLVDQERLRQLGPWRVNEATLI